MSSKSIGSDAGSWRQTMNIGLIDVDSHNFPMRVSMIHFAWDNYEMESYEMLKRIRPLIRLTDRKIRVYVLTNFNTTHEQDLERIYKLKEIGCDPFVMIYDKPNAPNQTKRLQRWCNNKFVFRACEKFEDYK